MAQGFDRRAFIGGAAVGLVVGGGGAYLAMKGDKKAEAPKTAAVAPKAPAVMKERIEMVMVSTWPRDFPGLGTGAQRLAKRIDDMSDGRIKVQYFAAKERVGAFDDFSEEQIAARVDGFAKEAKGGFVDEDGLFDGAAQPTLHPDHAS